MHHSWAVSIASTNRVKSGAPWPYRSRVFPLRCGASGLLFDADGVGPMRPGAVSFMACDLGYLNGEIRRLAHFANPFGTRLSPMSQVRGVTYVSGLDTIELAERESCQRS